jgi:hypothetical protein
MFKATLSSIESQGNVLIRQQMEILNSMGLSVAKREQRMNDLMNLINEAVMEIIQDANKNEEESLSKLKSFISSKETQVNDMLSALHLDPYVPETDQVLLIQGKRLKDKFLQLKKVKEEREERLQKLLKERDEHCSVLDEEAEQLNLKTNIPSEEELVQLQSYVHELLKERRCRLKKMTPLVKSLKSLVQEMDMDLESSSLDSGEESIDVLALRRILADNCCLSTKNIEKAIELHLSLEKKKESNIEKKQQLIDRLSYLLSRLNPDDHSSLLQTILSSYHGFSDKELFNLNNSQVQKYEQLRKERMSDFIAKIIPEVESMWNQICLSQQETKERREALEDNFLPDSEELLQGWEEELTRCQDYFSANADIFSALDDWRDAWITVEKIEAEEKNPDRYKSRKFVSTNFMKEQQLKKQSERTIVRNEKLLCSISDDYEREGTPFSIFGLCLKDYVQAKRRDYDQQKENERQAKKTVKAQQTLLEVNGGRNCIKNRGVGNFVPRTNTPSTPSKRSAMRENVSPSKLRRNNSSNNNVTPLINGRQPLVRQNTVVKGSLRNTQKCPSELSLLSVNEQEFQVRS